MYVESMFDESIFISLDKLSRHLGLPKCYLKSLADKGLMPFLEVNGHRRFDLAVAKEALKQLQHKGQGEQADGS
jgi:hypothetical protein